MKDCSAWLSMKEDERQNYNIEITKNREFSKGRISQDVLRLQSQIYNEIYISRGVSYLGYSKYSFWSLSDIDVSERRWKILDI